MSVGDEIVLNTGAGRRWYGGRSGSYDQTGEWEPGGSWIFHHRDYCGLEARVYESTFPTMGRKSRPIAWSVEYSLGRGRWTSEGRCRSVAEGLRLALRAFERSLREAWAAAWSQRTMLYQWDDEAMRWRHIGHGATWTTDIDQFTGVGTFAVIDPGNRPYYIVKRYGGETWASSGASVCARFNVPALILA